MTQYARAASSAAAKRPNPPHSTIGANEGEDAALPARVVPSAAAFTSAPVGAVVAAAAAAAEEVPVCDAELEALPLADAVGRIEARPESEA